MTTTHTTVPIVFLDTETDGLHPGRKVWEIGMIRRDEKGERETSFFVDIELSTADPAGLRIGRYYDRHPYGRWLSGQTEERCGDPWAAEGPVHVSYAAEEVARWTNGAHIVGAVPSFDTEVLAKLLRDNGLTPAWHHHLIDIEALMIGWLHATEAANVARLRAVDPAVKFKPSVTELPWKSDDLTAAIGVESTPADERHTALGDARWAMRVYDKVTGGAR